MRVSAAVLLGWTRQRLRLGEWLKHSSTVWRDQRSCVRWLGSSCGFCGVLSAPSNREPARAVLADCPLATQLPNCRRMEACETWQRLVPTLMRISIRLILARNAPVVTFQVPFSKIDNYNALLDVDGVKVDPITGVALAT